MAAVPAIDELRDAIPAGTPLEQLAGASAMASRLRARGEELLDHFVDAARAAGASWSEIGCTLGTSKQAAHERFGALADPPAGQASFGLTGTAAEVLSAAAEQARDLGHHFVKPEHLVLGLLAQPDELAAEVLAELGVTGQAARRLVAQRLGSGAPRPTGSLGVAPQTKRALELAQAIAKSLGNRCPKTEHILLAATSPKLHSAAAELLAELGRKRGGGSRPALANTAGGGARARRAAAQSPAARPASDAEPLAAPWRRIGVGISPKQHPNHRRPETSIGAQARVPGRGQPVQPPAGVPGAAHQTFALAASQDVMKDHLAGRLLTQTPDLHGGASGAKRTAMNRSKHRELDVTQRIAA